MFDQRRTSILTSFAKLTLAIWLSPGAPLLAQQPSSEAPVAQGMTPGVAVDSARKTADLPGYVTTGENEGKTLGGYEIKQTFEFGERVVDRSGSLNLWDSYISLASGPRLLEQ